MLSPAEIGVAEARSFLTGHLASEVDDVELVGEGAWSRGFGFTIAGRELVVRFGSYVEDFEKDRRASSFRSAALPVPEVIEIGRAYGGYFAVSARAHGVPIESIDATQWADLQPEILAMLDSIRSVDVSAGSGYGMWNARGIAPSPTWREFLMTVAEDTPSRRTHGWRARLIDSSVGDATFRAGLARLSELAEAAPAERYLVHADLINRNVLVDAGRITAVFDWGCSFFGDFLYDVAWLEFWSPWHPAIAATDARGAARSHYAAIGLDVPDLDARMRCCMLHIGLDHLAYCAHTGAVDDLVAIDAQTRALVE